MRHAMQIAVVAIALALAGSGGALARPVHHHPYSYRQSRVQSYGRIVGNRRTHVYFLAQTPSRLPAPQNRIYFGTPDEARAAGYRPAPRKAIPINPRLTWQGTRSLPSIGKQHVPPPPPKDMQKPVAPPADQQPPVTPTNPMPN
jgi:metal binding Ada-like protein